MRIPRMRCDLELDENYIISSWRKGYDQGIYGLQASSLENLITLCTNPDMSYDGALCTAYITSMARNHEEYLAINHMLQEHYNWEKMKDYDSDEFSLEHYNALISVMNKWVYRYQGGKKYQIAEQFCRMFMSKLFPSITFDMIPKGKCGFVQLPFSVDINNEPFDCFYYSTFKHDQFPNKYMQAATIGYQDPTNPQKYKPHIFMSLNNLYNSTFVAEPHLGNQKVMSWLDLRYGIPQPNERKRPCAIMFFLSLICYIHSGDPDIREFKNRIKKTNKGQVKPKDRKLAPGTVNLVGFDWKKTRLFDPHETEVAPYPAIRWKGTGAQKTPETVWVSGHTRNYGLNGKSKKRVG